MKQLLTSAEVLCSYNPELPLKLACQVSPCGVATVLGLRFPDGSEGLIAYSSKTLFAEKKNYSKLDKKALAIVFGVKRFQSFFIYLSLYLISYLVSYHRQQITTCSTLIKDRNFAAGCGPYAALGFDFIGLRLQT